MAQLKQLSAGSSQIIMIKEMVGMPFIPDELEKGATEFYE